jgi:hypothetical protein
MVCLRIGGGDAGGGRKWRRRGRRKRFDKGKGAFCFFVAEESFCVDVGSFSRFVARKDTRRPLRKSKQQLVS